MDFRQHTPYALHSQSQAVEAATLQIYTDGAYFKQHHLGGWGVAVYENETLIKTLNGVQLSQSSLEMELVAAIKAIEWAQDTYPQHALAVFTDAKILLEGLLIKYPRWQQNHWKSKNGNPVAYSELWQQLYPKVFDRPVTFYWVKSHFRNPKNLHADALARTSILDCH